MRKILLAISFLLLNASLAHGDVAKMTVYHPAPIGNYDHIRLQLNDASITCDAEHEGSISYYLDTTSVIPTHNLLLCSENDELVSLAGLWTQTANDLYPNNYGLHVGIGTNTPPFKLSIDAGNATAGYVPNGGIIAKGTFGSGTDLGNIGAGTYLIWYPKKATFRSGTVQGTQWNEANIGNYSTAFGLNTIASGAGSTATGSESLASGTASLALGARVSNARGASGTASTFMGYSSRITQSGIPVYYGGATGDYAVAFGNGMAMGTASFASGYRTRVSSPNSVVMTNSAYTGADNSVALGGGYGSFYNFELQYNPGNAWVNSVSLGGGHASGRNSLASGTVTTNSNAVSFGYSTMSTGTSSLSTGSVGEAQAAQATIMGDAKWVLGENSFAAGDNTEIRGSAATAIGFVTKAQSFLSTAMGVCNDIDSGNMTNWVTTDPIFTIGNGTTNVNLNGGACVTPSNALKILKNGVVKVLQSSSDPAPCTSAIYGGLYFKTTDSRLYGCRESGWVPLDN